MKTKMKIPKRINRIATTTIMFVLLAVLLFNFDSVFNKLNANALAINENIKKTELANIPSKINFLSDDKNSFLDYCKNLYGGDLPLTIDSDSFIYYGAVDGYRLYRMNTTYLPCRNVTTFVTLGCYTFTGNCRYSPEPSGLYLIGDDGVHTLSDAYSENIVDFSKVYQLYKSKADK